MYLKNMYGRAKPNLEELHFVEKREVVAWRLCQNLKGVTSLIVEVGNDLAL